MLYVIVFAEFTPTELRTPQAILCDPATAQNENQCHMTSSLKVKTFRKTTLL